MINKISAGPSIWMDTNNKLRTQEEFDGNLTVPEIMETSTKKEPSKADTVPCADTKPKEFEHAAQSSKVNYKAILHWKNGFPLSAAAHEFNVDRGTVQNRTKGLHGI